MRTTTNTARGKPLAVALLFLTLACVSGAVWGEGTLLVEQSLSPAQIYVAGMGTKPDVTSLGIALAGSGATGRFPLDCVVVIDTSISTELASAKEFAVDLIGRLGSQDRVGVVAFGKDARLVVPLADGNTVVSLANGTTRAQAAVLSLAEDTKSALGAGLQVAREELERNGRDNAVLLIVLIADGQNSAGAAPTIEGALTGEAGIRISTVGVVPIFNRALLKGLAEESGGAFVAGLGRDGVDVLADHLMSLPAATDVAITKRVPAGIRFVGSIPLPTRSHVEGDGSTTIVWEVARVELGETVRIEARFDASANGSLATDGLSKVIYRDYRGVTQEMAVAPLILSVIMPNRAPVASFSIEPVAPKASDVVAFHDQSLDPDGEDLITNWHWTFGDGTTSDAAEPQHTYSAGTYKATLNVVDEHGTPSSTVTRTIVVGNGLPVAAFLFRDASTDEQLLAPLVGANVILDATPSRDVDGTIARYRWDLDGDGDVDVESSDPTVSTSYADVGEQSITLWVTDDYGNVAETTATFEVVAGITVVRSIVTHLPGDEMIAGAVVEVTLTISVNASLHGMIVRETLPVPGAGWAFADVSSIPEPLSRPAVKLTSTSAEWAFAEDIVAGSSNSQRVIRYTLTVPSAVPSADRTLVALQGSVSSSSPRLSQATLGEDRITLLKYLSVPVAISCWNVATSAVDLMLGDAGIITSAQLNYAISLWESGSKVPATNDVIDAETLRELIAYAETRSSVYDPLP